MVLRVTDQELPFATVKTFIYDLRKIKVEDPYCMAAYKLTDF